MCGNFSEEQYGGASLEEWWLLAVVDYLDAGSVKSDSLQVEESGAMSKQFDNLRVLLDRLNKPSSAMRDVTRPLDRPLSTADGVFAKGQLTITCAVMNTPLKGLNVNAH